MRRQQYLASVLSEAIELQIPSIVPSTMARGRRPCRNDVECYLGAGWRAEARDLATTPRVLRRERGLPLPRAGLRRPPLRPGRAARRRLVPDRERGADLRSLASPLATDLDDRSRDTHDRCPPRARLRGDERLLLRRDR